MFSYHTPGLSIKEEASIPKVEVADFPEFSPFCDTFSALSQTKIAATLGSDVKFEDGLNFPAMKAEHEYAVSNNTTSIQPQISPPRELTLISIKMFSCEYCGRSFKTQYQVNEHRITHSGVKQFGCDYPGCEYRSYWKCGVKAHKLRHLEGEELDAVSLSCTECGKLFKRKVNLVTHLRRHQGLRLFHCDHPGCLYSAVLAATLAVHKKRHLPDVIAAIFVCEECGKRYRRNCRLVEHMRDHTGEQPFHCDFDGCSYSSARAWGLTKHKRTKHAHK